MSIAYKSSNGTSLAKTAPRILPDVSQELAEMRAEMARIREENEALRAQKAMSPIRIKVGEKGGMVVSGFGQYPYTFYHSQWTKFRANLDQIDAWFAANQSKLTRK